jgi:RNA polymerase sigma-70 factor, ECF subfamily
VTPSTATAQTEEAGVAAAIRAGDQAAFAALTERYRRPLHLYLYRMVGSVEDAEDLVQDTLLRAWRGRAGFAGRSLFRTWLYSIATNAALNALERTPRRVLPADVARAEAFEPRDEPPWAPEIPWLRPYPDHLLELMAPHETEPESRVVSRETIELAYLAAIQHLPPRQRAILVLRDALDWSAKETAALLGTSVASVNSALQRARSTMRTQLPTSQRDRAGTTVRPTAEERLVLQRFMEAWEHADAGALTALLRDDARWAMPPAPLWFDGRASIVRMFELYPPGWQGDFRMLPTAANRQPAAAVYLRPRGESTYRLVSLHVLRIEAGQIADVVAFQPELFRSFGLAATL